MVLELLDKNCRRPDGLFHRSVVENWFGFLIYLAEGMTLEHYTN